MTQRFASRPGLAVIGLFPPPVNGQSVLTEKIAAFLEARTPVNRVSLGRSKLRKIYAHTVAAWRIVIAKGRYPIYSTPPGQRGLWLFLMIVAAARMRKRMLFVHHHSFRPISAGPLLSVRLMHALGGRFLHHVFLGERMRDGFLSVYGEGLWRHSLLPNAFAYPPPGEAPAGRTGALVLGHLSVLTMEKGVARVLEIFARLRAGGSDIRLVLAGPIADQRLLPLIQAAQDRHGPAFEYRGAVFEHCKTRFFADIDLMLLPSNLLDEADPLVLQEAYEAGVDVMASDRGCIAERLRREDAFLSLDDMVDAARVEQMLGIIAAERAHIRRTNWQHAQALHERARVYADRLVTELLSDANRAG